MSNEDKPKKQPLTAEEIAKILEKIAEAYEAAGKKIHYATLYDKDNPDGLIMVPPDKNELEYEGDDDSSNNKNLPEFED